MDKVKKKKWYHCYPKWNIFRSLSLSIIIQKSKNKVDFPVTIVTHYSYLTDKFIMSLYKF